MNISETRTLTSRSRNMYICLC